MSLPARSFPPFRGRVWGRVRVFDVIRKTTYWSALDDPNISRRISDSKSGTNDGLKHIQDAWTFLQLKDAQSLKILEIGGGVSRILPVLDPSNERWNLDEFIGEGNGVSKPVELPGVKLVQSKMGNFSDELPDNYFDFAFSISVIEHVPNDFLPRFWEDHARVLKHGGRAVHTIDFYLGDERNGLVERRLNMYLEGPRKFGLRLESPSALSRPAVFTSDMASNSDWAMWRRNKIAPKLADVRATKQSVSLAAIFRKR